MFGKRELAKHKIIATVAALFLVYIFGYILIRQTFQETRELDGRVYVIFPNDKVFYYLYRPLSVIDEKTTGMNFHVGQHR